jgi:HSP20 family protein
MANISRFNPFPMRAESFGPFEDLVRRMWSPTRWEMESPMDIRIDVEEAENAYTVKAEIPGAKKEDIKVQIDGNMISISAESKREEEVKEKGQVVCSERYHGSMYRSFSLDHDIDESTAAAKYTDGVLTLTLPKKSGVAAKQLSIQ